MINNDPKSQWFEAALKTKSGQDAFTRYLVTEDGKREFARAIQASPMLETHLRDALTKAESQAPNIPSMQLNRLQLPAAQQNLGQLRTALQIPLTSLNRPHPSQPEIWNGGMVDTLSAGQTKKYSISVTEPLQSGAVMVDALGTGMSNPFIIRVPGNQGLLPAASTPGTSVGVPLLTNTGSDVITPGTYMLELQSLGSNLPGVHATSQVLITWGSTTNFRNVTQAA